METLEQIPFEEPAVNSFVLARNPSSPNEYMPQIKSCSLESFFFEIRHKREQVFQQNGREQRKTIGERQQQHRDGSKETSEHMRIVHQTLYSTWLYWCFFFFFFFGSSDHHTFNYVEENKCVDIDAFQPQGAETTSDVWNDDNSFRNTQDGCLHEDFIIFFSSCSQCSSCTIAKVLEEIQCKAILEVMAQTVRPVDSCS